MVKAKEEALDLGHREINDGHLLLALSRVHEDSTVFPLRQFGVNPGGTRRALVSMFPLGPREGSGHLLASESMKEGLTVALRRALVHGVRAIGSHHLLLAITDAPDGIASRLLRRIPADRDGIRTEVLRQLEAVERDPLSATVTATVSRDFPSPPEWLWLLIQTRYDPLTQGHDATYVRSYHVPGTPEGVGGRIAYVSQADSVQTTRISEITELVPGRRVVAKLVEPPDGIVVMEHVHKIRDGARVTVSYRWELASVEPGTRSVWIDSAAASGAAYLEQLRVVLDGGWEPADF